ncbi:MAG TPA: iron-sulfur cluster assembly scaffold protein [Planctomycetota bacterium]|nr:iron-sulfur cluster assembly scaffold protein [Planctomycetota bacterium]
MPFEDYNATVMDHFLNPRNTGELPGATHQSLVRNPACGDMVKLTLRVEGGIILDARAKTFGCAAAIASSSALTELLKGRTVADARRIRNADVVAFLGGLPEHKVICSVVAEEAVREALRGEPAA